jgi:alkylated DNA repair dioxygenase AlkB
LQVVIDYDGYVLYEEHFISDEESRTLYNHVLERIPLTSERITMFGKVLILDRKVAWIADPGITYTYSGKINLPTGWTKELIALKNKIETHLGASFNACLINYYPNGKSGMGYHQDNEKELGNKPIIASISIGSNRTFQFKHIQETSQKKEVQLGNGSLLVMKDTTQENWKHALKKDNRINIPRINLTFRKIIL